MRNKTGSYCYHYITAMLPLLFFVSFLHAQHRITYSLAYSAKEGPSSTLTINSDSFAAMEWGPDAVGERFGMGIACEVTDSTVVFFPRDPDRSIKSVFKKVDGGLINATDSVVYVSDSREHFRHYYIEGQHYQYVLNRPPTNGFQIVDSRPKELLKKLQKVEEKKACYDIKNYFGLEAYLKYGIEGAFGVTVIEKKAACP